MSSQEGSERLRAELIWGLGSGVDLVTSHSWVSTVVCASVRDRNPRLINTVCTLLMLQSSELTSASSPCAKTSY